MHPSSKVRTKNKFKRFLHREERKSEFSESCTRNELSEIKVGKNLRRIIGNDRIKNRLISERWL